MCLSIPAKVVSIEGEMAKVSVGNTLREASLQMIEDVHPGDYVLLHTGFAIQKIDEKEAAETLKLFEELEQIEKQMDKDDGG